MSGATVQFDPNASYAPASNTPAFDPTADYQPVNTAAQQATVPQANPTWSGPIAQAFGKVGNVGAKFVSGLGNEINPVSGIEGAAQAVRHPINTIMADEQSRADVYHQAEQEFKAGNYSAGALRLIYSAIPLLGPEANRIGNEINQGQVAKGVGESVGMGLNLASPSLIKDANLAPINASGAAERLYKSALKPSTTMAPEKLASAVSAGLENAIPVSAGGLEKVGDLLSDLNDRIKDQIAASPNQPINKFAVASRLGDTARKFTMQVNPEADLNAIAKSGNEFLENQPNQIPASRAQALKQGTYQQLKKSYGQLSNATMESQKALARGLKEELAHAFPELSNLNAEDSKLINLDGTLQRAVNRISNHQIMGIGTPLAGAGAKAITGSTGVAAVAAATKAILDDPYVKSQMAIALHRASNRKLTIPMGMAKYQGYVNALGSAANAQAPGDQGSQ